MKDIELIIGLGNPGPKYEGTFHNVGAFFVEKFKEYNIEKPNPALKDFLVTESFMNRSGFGVAELLKQRNIEFFHCLIIHDDADLEAGEYKISFGKDSAGHRGVEDIIRQFGSKDFWRLRVGIRNPDEQIRQKAGDFVLKKIPPELLKKFEETAEKAWQELL